MCTNCGSADVDTHGTVSVCCVCATVVDDVSMVAELVFHDGGGGGVSVGGFVYRAPSAAAPGMPGMPGMPGGMDGRESRMQSLERGRRLISQLATQVGGGGQREGKRGGS